MRFLVFLFASVTCATAAAAAWPVTQITAPNLGMQLGDGYDTITAERLPAPCVVVSATSAPNAGGWSENTSADYAASSSSIQSAFGLDGGAAFGFGLFSGSASVDYLKSSAFSQYSQTLVGSADVQAPVQTGNFAFGDDTIRDLFKHDPAAFREQCGDAFVSGILAGGRLQIAFSSTGSTQSELDDVRTAISGSYASLSANVALQDRLQSDFGSQNLSYNVTQQGPVGVVPGNGVDLIKFLLGFGPTVTPQNAWTTGYQLTSYDHLADAHTSESSADRMVDQLAARYVDELQLENSFAYADSHPDQFDPNLDRAQFNADWNASKGRVAELRDAATACSNGDPCVFPTDSALSGNVQALPMPIVFTQVILDNGNHLIAPPANRVRYLVIRGAWYRNDGEWSGVQPAGSGQGTRIYCTSGGAPDWSKPTWAATSRVIEIPANAAAYYIAWGSKSGSHTEDGDPPPTVGIFDLFYPEESSSASFVTEPCTVQ